MPEPNQGVSLLLPERARLLHIGPMKTGTTSLQSSARDKRAELRDHGVLYPGKRLNHRRAAGALMNRNVMLHARSGSIHSADSANDGVPARAEWDALMAEVDADKTRRVLISHELIGDVSKMTAQKFIDEIGPRAHVAITLRAPAAVLPALWIQGLKSAKHETFDNWLDRAFSRTGAPLGIRFNRAQDQAGIVERWASIVGPENVTVVVTDKSDPKLLGHAFEEMLGLPTDFLTDSDGDGFSTNRSMTLPEAELVRRINKSLTAEKIDWATYIKVVRNGIVGRILANRVPPKDEPRVRLPDWAAELAVNRGEAAAKKIAESGVRVVGDLTLLHEPPRTSEGTKIVEIPADLGVESAVGAAIVAGKAHKQSEAKSTRSGARKTTASAKNAPAVAGARRATSRILRKGASTARRLIRRGK